MTNDWKMNSSRPNIDDSILDRHLGSLPGFDPCPGFEDRVMSRVLVPPPRWMLSVRRSARWLVETRRIRWLATGLMATSMISLVLVTTLVLNNLSAVSRVLDWMTTTMGLPVWRAFLRLASESARDVYALLTPLPVSRTMALIASAASLGFLAFNTWMLLLLMRPKRITRYE